MSCVRKNDHKEENEETLFVAHGSCSECKNGKKNLEEAFFLIK